MCGGSKSDLGSFDLAMGAGFQEGKTGIYCSKLLELAATDDLAGFVHEVEERGCDVNEASFWYGRSFGSKKMGFEERTPIMIASLYGSVEVLKYVISTGKVDVNRACGSDGATALHCAAAGGSWPSVEVVELLIGAAGDISALDAEGRKPGDLIASCVRNSNGIKRKAMVVLLNGGNVDVEEEEEGRMRIEKKEYPIDVPLPDINIGIYGTDEFRMYNFKVKPCSRAYSHDWTECPFVHPGENARRRDPRKYSYTCVPCPEFKKGSCGKGDGCEYAHGVFESWLHPAQYKTRLCKDEIGCARKVCFFAHKPEELRPLYAATGSAMPSPKADLGGLSPLMMANASTPPISPCSSPMGGSMWQSKAEVTPPPSLQLPGSRLKTTRTARDIDLDMNLLGLDEMASLSSPYGRIGDLKPTNLDEFFGSLDPSVLSHLQGLSPKFNTTTTTSQYQSPTALAPNMSHLRSSYPTNTSLSPSRNYSFDSSSAVAAAVMNSRSSAFTKRSQSFIDRAGIGYRPSHTSSPNSSSLMPSKLSNWGSPDGRLEWGFNGEDASKLRKSASFGLRRGSQSADEAGVSWGNDVPPQQRHGGVHERMPHWVDQMYMEQEQLVA